MGDAYLKHKFYEELYPDHKLPVTLTEIKDKLDETIKNIRASTPRKPLKEWSSVEVKRWTSNLPIKGLKAVVEEVLADIDGVTLAGLADEDLSAAGMTSKIHRAQLIKMRDIVLKRDAEKAKGKTKGEEDFGQALGFLTGTLEVEPTVQQAEAFEMLGEAAAKGGKKDEAIALLRKALECCSEVEKICDLQIRESAQGEVHVDVGTSIMKLSNALEENGEEEEAEDLLLRALKVNEEAAGPESEAVACTLERMLVLLDKQGRTAECSELADRLEAIRSPPIVQIIREYVTADNVRRVVLYVLAAILFLQMVAPKFLDPVVEALPSAWRYQWKFQVSRTRLIIWEKYHGEGHPATTPYMLVLADVYEMGDRLDEASRMYNDIISSCKDHGLGKDPIAATSYSRLGRIAILNGDISAAEKHLTKAISIYTTTGDMYEIIDLAAAQSQLAEILKRKGNYKDAEPLFRQAIAIQEANHDYIDGADFAATLAGLGHVLAVTGQAEEAGNLTDRALKLTERAFSGMVSKEVLTRVLTAGETMEAMGNYIKAGGFFKRAADLALKLNGITDETVARSFASLAKCLARLEGKGKEAEMMSRESIRIATAGLGQGNPRLAYFYSRRGGLLASGNRFDEAQDILNQAKDLLESAGAGADMEVWATVHTNLGGILLSKGEKEQAAKHMREVLRIREKILGEYHPEVGDAASNLAIVMASLGNTKEAALLVEKAKVAWEAGYGEDTMHSRLGLLKARVDIHLSEVMEPVPA